MLGRLVRSHRHLLLSLLAALTLALGLVACGGDDDDGGGSSGGGTETQAQTQPETTADTETEAGTSESGSAERQEYLEAINGAQREFASGAQELNLSRPDSPAAFKRSLDKFVGLVETLIGDLQDVTPPEAVASEHDELITALEDYNDVLQKEKGGLTSGSNAKVRESAQAIGTASTQFSQTFDATIQQINQNLR
jgi:hypothetical protein